MKHHKIIMVIAQFEDPYFQLLVKLSLNRARLKYVITPQALLTLILSSNDTSSPERQCFKMSVYGKIHGFKT
jgi:hypothetical protein